jgi:hypothetical protein
MARSSNAAIQQQLNQIEQLLVDGMGLQSLAEEYASVTGQRLSQRTLLRRVNQLLGAKRAVSEGAGRGTRYRSVIGVAQKGSTSAETGRAAEPTSRTASSPTSADADEGYIPLSEEGAAIRLLVSKPKADRPMARHNPDFLENYEPGVTWYLTAETRAHLHQIGHTPAEDEPAGTYARGIIEHLLIDLSWASSHLEGNRYSKLDTKELLRYGREAEGKNASETQMILNHRAAIEMLVEKAEEVGFNRYTFLGLHALLSENLLGDRFDEGRLRTRAVVIGQSTYTPPVIPQKIEEHFDLLLQKAGEIPDPFEQAFFVLVHLSYLQPFIDVNKRTSRLGANLPLIKANLRPLSFVGVPKASYVDGLLGVYEFQRIGLLRDVFVWAYERSCEQYAVVREAMGIPDPIRLAYRDQLREVVRDMVQKGILAKPVALKAWAQAHSIPSADLELFVNAAREEFVDLHEGSLRKYGLRPSEYQAWNNLAKDRTGKRAVTSISKSTRRAM